MVSAEDFLQTNNHLHTLLRGRRLTPITSNTDDDDEPRKNDSILSPSDPSRRDEILQLCFSTTFIVLFCIMVCISLFGRRARASSGSSTRDRNSSNRSRRSDTTGEPPLVSTEDIRKRKELVARSILVQRVAAVVKGSQSTLNTADCDLSSSSFDSAETATTTATTCFDPDTETGGGGGGRGGRRDQEQNSSICPHHKSARILPIGKNCTAYPSLSYVKDEWVCAICISEFMVGEEICWSPNGDCRHVFHRACIAEWLVQHDECPCCRCQYLRTSGS